MPIDRHRRRAAGFCLLIVLVTLAVYWPVTGFELTNYDDNLCVSQNEMVSRGITLEGVRWAFTTHYYDYWHPQGLSRAPEAVARYREALRLKPDTVEVLNNLAWILATHSDPQLRDAREAVERAERACTLTGRRQPMLLGTLAAAYAAAGQFDKAVETARPARDLAETLGHQEIAARNQELLELYQQGKPFREPSRNLP